MSPALISAQWLQRLVGALGLLFPVVLAAIAGERESISAYYHSPARDVFVGWLSAIVACLAVYRGYDGPDRTCARVAAVGLAVLTYAPTGGSTGLVHLAGALVFFGAVAMLVWRFGMGSRPRVFRGLSLGITACISWALVSGLTGGSIFWQEAGAVFLFGAAWLTKGRILEKGTVR